MDNADMLLLFAVVD